MRAHFCEKTGDPMAMGCDGGPAKGSPLLDDAYPDTDSYVGGSSSPPIALVKHLELA
jgi:hypothetical protein